jgi:hypothetical protein
MASWAKVLVAACTVTTIGALGAVGTGCTVKDDADRFREAIPQSEDVALNVPSGGSGATTTKGLHIATNGPTDSTARYYRFTRDTTRVVDLTTGVILGVIWAVVNQPPTTIDAKHAVWGPGGGDNALEPLVWRFTVTEVGDAEYDYALEARPKADPGADFIAVLTGHGYGESRPEHRTGWFQADNDAARELDPDENHDEGTTKVIYDLRQKPATIKVELRPGADEGYADVLVTHDAGGAGSVEISGLGDIDDSKATKLEDLHLLSRWDTTGAGRADIEMNGGDLPFTVDASECWSSSFARVFYKDTVDYEPPTGDPSACSLPKE